MFESKPQFKRVVLVFLMNQNVRCCVFFFLIIPQPPKGGKWEARSDFEGGFAAVLSALSAVALMFAAGWILLPEVAPFVWTGVSNF